VRTDAAGIKLVWVPPGCFLMGSDPAKDTEAQSHEQPQHKVCITKGYWISQYEVTNAAFDAFAKAGGYNQDDDWSADGLKWRQSNGITGPDTTCTQYSKEPEQPRICVSYYEAEAYVNWRTRIARDGTVYRLPTEAKWEYAVRGPESLIYLWGNDFDAKRLNYCDKNCSEDWRDKTLDDGYQYSSPVGRYETGKSWVNAYDMAGNAWEWVSDWHDQDYYKKGPQNDPPGPTRGINRVARGGSWRSTQGSARAASRYRGDPGDRAFDLGFRMVASAPAS
jgi:formylglycine-generating enzyme required for sulfatase activity